VRPLCPPFAALAVKPCRAKTNHTFKQRLRRSTPRQHQRTIHRLFNTFIHRKGLLYAGTETGIYFSDNDGAGWRPLQLNLPVTPIHDLALRNNDLVAGTYGRSFWILDDLTRLYQVLDIDAAPTAKKGKKVKYYNY
jgi:hypothetical protein